MAVRIPFALIVYLWPATVLVAPTNLHAEGAGPFSPIVVAESGPFRLLSTPQIAPEGLRAAIISVETTNLDHRVVTIDNVALTGDVHQVWLDHFFGSPTVTPDRVVESPVFHGEWTAADTHLLIAPSMVGGGAGGSYAGISEANDGSDPMQLGPKLPLTSAGFPPLVGIGELRSDFPTDAFFLDTPFQTNRVDVAYVVTPNTDPLGQLSLTFGIQGGDEANLPIGPVDFVDVTLSNPFFSPPCDFDADGSCELSDLDALLMAVGTNEEQFNLEPSALPIDFGDVARWLEIAGLAIVGEPYVTGDTDLDGDVDAGDLNKLALNWQIVDAISWGQGDSNADGRVDAADLNALSINWQHGVEPVDAIVVPEPAGAALIVIGWLIYPLVLRWPRKQATA